MKRKLISLFASFALIISLLGSAPICSNAWGNIKIGDYIEMGSYYGERILWRCVDIDENGPLMLSDKILCLKPFDVPGSVTTGSHGRGYGNGYYRKKSGSNYWGDSNIRSWLNSNEPAGEVTWLCGNPPTKENIESGFNAYADEAGFLTNFSQIELSAIKEVKQKSILDGFEHCDDTNEIMGNYLKYDYNISNILTNYDYAYSEYITDKMFLLDIKQINSVYNNSDALGNHYYVGQPTAQCIINSESQSINSLYNSWLRTPEAYSPDSYSSRCVSQNKGLVYYTHVETENIGVRPAFYLDLISVSLVSGLGTAENPYLIDKAESYDVTFVVDDVPVCTITKFVGDVLTLAEFPVLAQKEGYLGRWSVTFDIKNTMTVTAIYDKIIEKVNIGDYVQLGTYYDEPILWRCVDIDENGPLMLSDKILCLKAYDAAGGFSYGSHNNSYYASNLQGYYRIKSGSDYWADSNIRTWLNSDKSPGNIIWPCGNAPVSDKIYLSYNSYDNEAGFLTNFTETEMKAVREITQKSILNGYEQSNASNIINDQYHKYDYNISDVLQNYDTCYSEKVIDKIFLPDVKQINAIYRNSETLGNNYYIGIPTEQCVENSDYKNTKLSAVQTWHSWLRNPKADGFGSDVRYVDHNGSVLTGQAYNSTYGIRPAFYLNQTSMTFTTGRGTATTPYANPGPPVFFDNEETKIIGSETARVGDIFSCNLYYMANRAANAALFEIQYPSDLKLNSVHPIGFDHASVNETKTMDGMSVSTVVCQYSTDTANTLPGKTYVPFSMEFQVSEQTAPSIKRVDIKSAEIYTDTGSVYPISEKTAFNIEIIPREVDAIKIEGDDNIIDSAQYLVTVTPDFAQNKNIIWSVNDETVATISQTGYLTALKNGMVDITATAADGSGVIATKSVIVTAHAKIKELKSDIGAWFNTFNPLENSYKIYVPKETVFIGITPTFSGGTLTCNSSKLMINNVKTKIDLTEDITTIELSRTGVTDTLDNTYTITFIKSDSSECFSVIDEVRVVDDHVIITISALQPTVGSVFVPMYFDGQLIDISESNIQLAAGEKTELTFTIESKNITDIKVLIWNSFDKMIPLTKPYNKSITVK